MKTSLLCFLAAGSNIFTSVHASCGHLTSVHKRAPGAGIQEPTFGYEGLLGPLNWAGLKTENALCSTGQTQSPVNLVRGNASVDAGSAYVLNIPKTTSSEFENLGTTVEILVNGTLETALKSYKMAQFHFHTPSEHRINGEYFEMESHFVFEAEDKSKAVVSFLIDLGANDPLMGTVLPSISNITTLGQVTATPPLDFTALQGHLAANTVFRYVGSLTTPPCTEQVDWIISTAPLSISPELFTKAKSVIKFNSRVTQGDLGKDNLLATAASKHAAQAAAAAVLELDSNTQ